MSDWCEIADIDGTPCMKEPGHSGYHESLGRVWGCGVTDYPDAPTVALEPVSEVEQLRAQVARLRGALRKLMLSRDATWAGGHDWQEAIDEATAALSPAPEAVEEAETCAE